MNVKIDKQNLPYTYKNLIIKILRVPMCLSCVFSHIRLRKPTGSLVLDRSIRDGDLARCITTRCKLTCQQTNDNSKYFRKKFVC